MLAVCRLVKDFRTVDRPVNGLSGAVAQLRGMGNRKTLPRFSETVIIDSLSYFERCWEAASLRPTCAEIAESICYIT